MTGYPPYPDGIKVPDRASIKRIRYTDLVFPIRPKSIQSVKAGKGFHFQPKEVTAWKTAIRLHARKQFSQPIMTGPLSVDELVFYFQWPKDNKRVPKTAKAGYFEGEVHWAEVSNDLMDNLAKGLFDALNEVVYEDDRQIVTAGPRHKVDSPLDCIFVRISEIEKGGKFKCGTNLTQMDHSTGTREEKAGGVAQPSLF